jgi:hypothetical protein
MELPIWTKYGLLDSGFCKHVINKFNSDKNKHDGFISAGVIDKKIKSSIDLNISGYPEWAMENEEFEKRLSDGIHEYKQYLTDINPSFSPLTNKTKNSGFQIQRTDSGGGYTWHSDAYLYNETNQSVVRSHIRAITYIFYLNTIPDTQGGYTEFVDGTRIISDQGKLLLFPASWEYVHRGFPPTNITKYIATGWIYNVIKSSISENTRSIPSQETRNSFFKVPQ